MNAKELQQIILHGTADDIIKAYKSVHGKKSAELSKEWGRFTSWLFENASSRRAYNNASDRVWNECMMKHHEREVVRMKRDHSDHFDRMHVLAYLREHLTNIRSHSRYAKVPMIGYTHLYMCSQIFGHSDYNKWQALPIRGNEEFCAKIVELVNKVK